MDISKRGTTQRLEQALEKQIFPEDECLLWAGEFKDGVAVFKDTVFTGRKFSYKYYPIILELVKKHSKDSDEHIWLIKEGKNISFNDLKKTSPTCNKPGCVKPAHCRLIQRVQQWKDLDMLQ